MNNKILSVLERARALDLPTIEDTEGNVALAMESLEAMGNPEVDGIKAKVSEAFAGLEEHYDVDSELAIESATMAHLVTNDGGESYMRDLGDSGVASNDGALSLALERFDPEYSHNNQQITVTYNYLNAGLDSVTEAIDSVFPPINVGTSAGATFNTPYAVMLSEDQHIPGAPYAPKRLPISSVFDNGLSSSTVRVYPVNSTDNADFLADPADVSVLSRERLGETIEILPYKFNTEIDYIATNISPATVLIGNPDHTDTLDHGVRLSSVYAKFGADVIRINTLGAQSSLFTQARQGTDSLHNMVFADEVVFDERTLLEDGSPLGDLTQIFDDKLTVTVKINASGTIDLAEGVAGNVVLSNMKVTQVLDDVGDIIPLDDASITDLIAKIEGFEPVGYFLKMYFTNSNRRWIDNVIDLTNINTIYPATVHPALTIRRPTSRNVSETDLGHLLYAAKADKAYRTVKAVEEAAVALKDYTNVVNGGLAPTVFGIGAKDLNTVYYEDELDLSATLNSVSHANRAIEVNSLLMGYIAWFGNAMFTEGGYTNAISARYQGRKVRPVLTVLTSERIRMHLREPVTKDLGTLFDIKVVSLPVEALEDTVYMMFNFVDDGLGNFNTLNFGCGVKGVDLVYNLRPTRSGATYRELAVNPRYGLHINSNVLAKLTITNWLAALGKVN